MIGFGSTPDAVVIGIVEEFVDLFGIVRLAEFASEGVFGQVLEDELHRLQVFFRTALRAQEEEHGVHRLFVKGVEINPLACDPDRGGHLFDAGVLHMGDGDTTPEPGGMLAFAFEQFLEQFVADRRVGCTGRDERVDEL